MSMTMATYYFHSIRNNDNIGIINHANAYCQHSLSSIIDKHPLAMLINMHQFDIYRHVIVVYHLHYYSFYSIPSYPIIASLSSTCQINIVSLPAHSSLSSSINHSIHSFHSTILASSSVI